MARRVGLRTEILVTLSFLLSAALLLGGIMMLRVMEANLLDEKVQSLDAFTQLLSKSGIVDQNAVISKDLMLRILPESVHCKAWILYGADLKVLDSSDVELTGPKLSPVKIDQVLRNGELQRHIVFPSIFNLLSDPVSTVTYLSPLSSGRLDAVIQITYSLDNIRSRLMQSVFLVAAYTFFYGVVLLFTGYFLLQRNIIHPAQNLLTATYAVGKGQLETRLPVEGPNEIRRLAEAYNSMVTALNKSRIETSQHIASLESINEKLKQTKNELVRKEKLASIGQLTAGLAHELGNPLAALIGYLELLKLSSDDKAVQELLERSLVETSRIDFLVRDLLDFSRSYNLDQFEAVDPVKVLNSSVTLLLNQGILNYPQIENNLPAETSTIHINMNKLTQVYVNILLNAVQAYEDGGLIVLNGGVDKKHVWVSIGDHGCGIPPDLINKIFDPFYTTKPPGSGTGLGLAMCQRTIEEAGGSIDVESVYGEGSTFKIMFKVQ